VQCINIYSKYKKNRNENENKLSTKTKKIELRQVVSRFVVDLNSTSSKDFFVEFYDFAIKSLCDFESLARLLDNNIISFYFIFVCALLTYTFIKNRKREDAYR